MGAKAQKSYKGRTGIVRTGLLGDSGIERVRIRRRKFCKFDEALVLVRIKF
jgi:hypothetical protein